MRMMYDGRFYDVKIEDNGMVPFSNIHTERGIDFGVQSEKRREINLLLKKIFFWCALRAKLERVKHSETNIFLSMLGYNIIE